MSFYNQNRPTTNPTQQWGQNAGNNFGNQNNNFGRGTQSFGIPKICGKLIYESLDEIKPQDVPMDGALSYFPAADNSCIFVRGWGTNGTIETLKFVPENTPANNQPSIESLMMSVMDRLDKIENMLSDPKESYTENRNNRSNNNRNKQNNNSQRNNQVQEGE